MSREEVIARLQWFVVSDGDTKQWRGPNGTAEQGLAAMVADVEALLDMIGEKP